MNELILPRRAGRRARRSPPQAQAQTLRWASQGDPQTMDPHSQNESLTNSMNGQVYETLVNRDKTARASCRRWPPSGSRSRRRCGASSCGRT